MAYLGTPYRVVYASKNYATGVGFISCRIVRPDATILGTFSLSPMPGGAFFSGLYYFDLLTSVSDPQGQWIGMIQSPTESISAPFRINFELDPVSDLWNAPIASYNTPGTFGYLEQQPCTVSNSSVTDIVSGVWNATGATYNTTNTMGAFENLIPEILEDVASLPTDPASESAILSAIGDLDLLMDTENSLILAVKAKTDNLPPDPASASAVAAIPTNPELATDPRLAYLDAFVSSRATPAELTPLATSAALAADTADILAELTSLESGLPAIASTLTTVLGDVVAIEAKTANLPSDPASESSVVAIPTDPLLSTDTRLNHLDANISSRATPADLSTLATASSIAAETSTILGALSTISTEFSPLATSAELTAATDNLAEQTTLLEVQTTVDSLSSGTLTAADVWNYVPRSITVPVDTTDDLAPLAKTTDVLTAEANILAALGEGYDCQLAAVINPALDVLTMQVWLEQNTAIVTGAQTAEIDVYNSVGAVVISGLTSSTPTAQGVFTLTYSNASTVFLPNQAYTAMIQIVKGINTYETTRSITTFKIDEPFAAVRCYAEQTIPIFLCTPPPSGSLLLPGNQPPNEKALNFPQLTAFRVEHSDQVPMNTEPADENDQP